VLLQVSELSSIYSDFVADSNDSCFLLVYLMVIDLYIVLTDGKFMDGEFSKRVWDRENIVIGSCFI
jgi:hypothetical protein